MTILQMTGNNIKKIWYGVLPKIKVGKFGLVTNMGLLEFMIQLRNIFNTWMCRSWIKKQSEQWQLIPKEISGWDYTLAFYVNGMLPNINFLYIKIHFSS